MVARLFLFQGAPADLLQQALADPSCTVEDFEKGQVIYAPRDFRRSLGVLLCGSVQVTKGEMVVSILCQGEMFGAAALFNRYADYVTTLTARSACRVVFFPQGLVRRLIAQDSGIAMAYISYLSGRIHFLGQKIEGLIAGTAQQKLAQYLLCNMDEKGEVHAAATAIARGLNLGRASLYRAFEALENQGAIAREGKCITVLDTEKLHEEKLV